MCKDTQRTKQEFGSLPPRAGLKFAVDEGYSRLVIKEQLNTNSKNKSKADTYNLGKLFPA